MKELDFINKQIFQLEANQKGLYRTALHLIMSLLKILKT